MQCFLCKETKSKEVYNCDGCKNLICKNCGNLSSSEIKVLELRNGRTLKFHCPKCIKNETFTILHDLIETKTQAMKSKDDIITMLKDQIEDLKNKVNEVKFEIPRTSYANIVNKGSTARVSKINVPNLVIRPKKSQNIIKTKEDVQTKLNPSELNIGIKDFKTTKNGNIIIKCQTKQDIETLKKAAEDKLKREYEVETTKMLKPKVKIAAYEGTKTAEEIENSIRKQNTWITEGDEIKITYIKQKQNKKSTIFAVCSASLFHKFMNFRKVFIDWERYPIYEDLTITRCFNCQNYYHKNKLCNNKKVCEICAEEHDSSTCPKISKKCNNCAMANARYQTNYCVTHAASDPECPTYKYHMDVLKSKIDYTQ